MYSRFIVPEEVEEIVCFQYQRMMRYGGKWHMEKRPLLPGCIFLSGAESMTLRKNSREDEGAEENRMPPVSLVPCEVPYVRKMCLEDNVIGISQGIIQKGRPVVMSGPLKGREELIRKIDRHKRTAEIEIPFSGDKRRVTIGLEIYEKQT